MDSFLKSTLLLRHRKGPKEEVPTARDHLSQILLVQPHHLLQQALVPAVEEAKQLDALVQALALLLSETK
jgi:hypothetical protein